MSDYEIILKLVLACILGGLVGLERESLNRPAGLRTYTLVCMGATLAMIVSMEVYYQFHNSVNADPGRIAAQVVSGIGFLGAGTIMREGLTVRGLTTAAGLWVVACIGLAVGVGMYLPAIVTTALILFILIYFVRFEDYFTGLREYKAYLISMEDKPGQIGRVGSALGELGILIKNIQMNRSDEEGLLDVEVLVHLPPTTDPDYIIEYLSQVSGVKMIERMN